MEMLYLLHMRALLNCCSDIEINPCPKQSSLTFFHWNLNGNAPHNFIKISVLQGYITDCNFDIILNSSLIVEDDRLKIEG